MKRSPLIPLLFLVTMSAWAFGQVPAIHHRHTAAAPGLPAAQKQPKNLSSVSERLIGLSDYYYNGAAYALTDTAFYSYSNGRYQSTNQYVDVDYYYDNSGEMIYNSGSGTYQNYKQSAQTFDANNNLLTSITQNWSGVAGAYVDTLQYVYTYASNNNIRTFLTQLWDNISGSWQNSENYLYTFDVNNNLTNFIDQKWDVNTAAWRNFQQQLITFNSSNQNTMEVIQNWDTLTSLWVNLQEYLPTYDANNNVTVQLNLYWNGTASAWDTSSLGIYSYNAGHHVTTELYQGWNATTHTWFNEDSAIYNFNANGNDTAYVYLEWTGAAWVNANQYLQTFDANGNETSYISQYWDGTHSLWVNQNRYRNTFDSDNSVTMQITDTWNVGGFWEPVSTDRQSFYYYQDYNPSGITPLVPTGAKLNVYPSPATDILSIDLSWNEAQPATMAIYDVSGRLCRQWQVSEGTAYQANISVSQLPAGSYYMTAKAQNRQITKNFIVAR